MKTSSTLTLDSRQSREKRVQTIKGQTSILAEREATTNRFRVLERLTRSLQGVLQGLWKVGGCISSGRFVVQVTVGVRELIKSLLQPALLKAVQTRHYICVRACV